MSDDITLVRVAKGVYMEERDPVSVMIVPEEVLAGEDIEPDKELLVATYEALAAEYRKAGFEPMLLKNPPEAPDADR